MPVRQFSNRETQSVYETIARDKSRMDEILSICKKGASLHNVGESEVASGIINLLRSSLESFNEMIPGPLGQFFKDCTAKTNWDEIAQAVIEDLGFASDPSLN